jgi:hypothetical protein
MKLEEVEKHSNNFLFLSRWKRLPHCCIMEGHIDAGGGAMVVDSRQHQIYQLQQGGHHKEGEISLEATVTTTTRMTNIAHATNKSLAGKDPT